MRLKVFIWIVVSFVGILLLVGAGSFLYFSYTLPPVKRIEDYNPPVITKVFSHDGKVIGEFYRERRILVPWEKIPKLLCQAFIAAEDADFYHHKGISYAGIARAILRNLEAGRIIQGGSTITQQVVRSLLLSRKRTLSRKIRELMLAHDLEKHLSKDEILYIYLNQIYLGHGNYGVEAAAEDYFGKSVDELNLAEMALLAGLPQAPERYSPYRYFERAKRRQAYVLKRMVEEGYITQKEAEEAFLTPLHIRPKSNPFLEIAPYFVEQVRVRLKEKYGEDLLYTGGLRIYTSLDVRLQEAAKKALRKGLIALDRRQGFRGPVKVLKKGEIGTFCRQVSEQIGEDLKEGRVYLGVVTGFSRSGDKTFVRIGEKKGFIPFETMRWARKPNPKVDPAEGRIRYPWEALKKGYVVKVRVKEILPDGEAVLLLEQEPEVQGAILAMELPTGYVRSMVGGWDFLQSQFNRALQARRQPGSAFKPIVYAAALESGFTPASILIDSPVIYHDVAHKRYWRPKNFKERFYGPVRLRVALAKSINVATIKLAQRVSVSKIIKYARRLGITSPLTHDLSLALGSSEVTLQELVRAYAVFATGGHLIEPIYITRVEDAWGNVLEERKPLPLEGELREKGEELEEESYCPRVISAETAYLMTSLLQSVVKEGTGWRAKALGRPCAGKTGTTDEYTDAWFIGFTPELIAGVWVGFDEKKSLGKNETGSRAASPIWVDFMKEALKGVPPREFPVPERIIFVRIDPKTGLLARPTEEGAFFECFKLGTQPTEYADEVSPPREELLWQLEATYRDTGKATF